MKNWFILFSLVIYNHSFAQIGSSGLTESFAFEVKTIDDFIERFNFEANTGFMGYLKDNYPDEELSRQRLLISLFNYKNKSFRQNSDIVTFINQITDSLYPKYISFYDHDWYVELECEVTYKAIKDTLNLVLKVEKDEQKATKWSIVSAKAEFLESKELQADSQSFIFKNEYMKNRMHDKSRYFLHPMSHALDFMNVDEAFDNKNKFEYYIYSGNRSNQLNQLIQLVQKSQIRFIQVNAISYHFLQLKGWIMIVDYYNRNEKNSGWLINSLIQASPREKRDYLDNELNIQIN